jgi:hypothetical protein
MGKNIIQSGSLKYIKVMRIFISLFSIILTAGTFFHNFLIINENLIFEMMKFSAVENVLKESITFTRNFRIIGCIYIIANFCGVLSVKYCNKFIWSIILITNFTQGLGFIMIPPIVWKTIYNHYGILGLIPTVITDGGGLIIFSIMIVFMLKYKSLWVYKMNEK